MNIDGDDTIIIIKDVFIMVDFCLPVYNEEKILEKNVKKLLNYCENSNFNFAWQITIINNGSTDTTKEIAHRLISDKIKYFEVSAPGRGRALKEYWLISDCDILAYMDVDLAVSLEHVPALIEPIITKEADLVMGSRRLTGAKYSRTFFRDCSSKIYLFLARLFFKHRFTDFQCGFKAITREAFHCVASQLSDNRWFFDTELVIFLSKLDDRKIKEVAVNWEENRYQNRKSKVNYFRDGLTSLFDLCRLRRKINRLYDN